MSDAFENNATASKHTPCTVILPPVCAIIVFHCFLHHGVVIVVVVVVALLSKFNFLSVVFDFNALASAHAP